MRQEGFDRFEEAIDEFRVRFDASISSAWKGSSEGSFRAVAASAFCHLLNFDDAAPRSSTMRARTGYGDGVSERNEEIG